jgi:hypothetical protein
MKNIVQRWEWIGVLFIVAFGASLHFAFEWSGYSRPVALIAAVNESTWEHFKIAFWPTIIWALIEYPALKNQSRNFIIAKAAGLLTMPLVTAVFFYGYTAFTGQHFLLADVIIFIVAVIAGQWVSMRLLSRPQIEVSWLRGLALGAILMMVVAFATLSYYPPKNFLFAHPESGEYGILSEYHHDEH